MRYNSAELLGGGLRRCSPAWDEYTLSAADFHIQDFSIYDFVVVLLLLLLLVVVLLLLLLLFFFFFDPLC